MAPLRYAVGLIHNKQRDAAFPQHGTVLGIFQSLRGYVDQLAVTFADHVTDLPLLGAGERRIQFRTLDFCFFGLLYLVLHQRNQRRDYDRGLRQEQRRELESQRFATAGRHHAKSVPAGEDCFHNFELSWAKMADVEALRGPSQAGAVNRRMRRQSGPLGFGHGKGLDTNLHAASGAPPAVAYFLGPLVLFFLPTEFFLLFPAPLWAPAPA